MQRKPEPISASEALDLGSGGDAAHAAAVGLGVVSRQLDFLIELVAPRASSDVPAASTESAASPNAGASFRRITHCRCGRKVVEFRSVRGSHGSFFEARFEGETFFAGRFSMAQIEAMTDPMDEVGERR